MKAARLLVEREGTQAPCDYLATPSLGPATQYSGKVQTGPAAPRGARSILALGPVVRGHSSR
jgi:hypothetical protein